MTWKWIGGRLCRGKISLSVTKAYEAIPGNPEIARACKGVLISYEYRYPRKNTPPMSL